MAQTYVKVGSSPVLMAGYPEETSDDNGKWTIVRKYWQRTANVSHHLPAHNATTDEAGNTVTDKAGNTLKCRYRRISAGRSPGISIVELTYALSSTSISFKAAPDNPRSVSLRGQEVPIDDSRLTDHFSAAEIAQFKADGYVSQVIYGIEYTYTEVDASFAWTEAAIIASLQDTGVPPGISSGTAANWRLTGKEIEETDAETIIRTHYEYDANGFVST